MKHIIRSLPQPLSKQTKKERSQPIAHQLVTIQKEGNAAISLLLAVQTELLQVQRDQLEIEKERLDLERERLA